MKPLANQLKWIIGLRLVVVTSAVLLQLLLRLFAVDVDLRAGYLYLVAAGVYVASFIYMTLLRLFPERLFAQAYLQFIVDLLIITGLVSVTGGISSPFSMLYLVIISVAAALLRRRAGMVIAQIAWLLYAGLLVVLYSQDPNSETVPLLIYNLFSTLLGFAGVAVLTSYLARNIARAEEELVAATTSLEELEVMHRDVIESIASGIITTDLEGRIVSINRAGREILDRSEGDLLGSAVYKTGLMTQEQWSQLSTASSIPERVRDEGEVRRGGEVLYVGFSVNDLSDADGERRGYIIIFQDLTDWRKLQEEVQLKDRMAAVGELAAGIAHEIGNPLAAISGSVQMLSHSASPEGSTEKLLGIILQESRRLDRTIKSFLRFARPRERTAIEFDIAQLLAENLTLLRNSEEVLTGHLIELDLDPPSALLQGDPDQISQIFWNVTRNALRAMPEGGTLRIGGRMAQDSYLIRFADTGRGMSERERANLFHPYHTFFDGGVGIGMAIVYRIVEEHGGRISVHSAPDAGTIVEVRLPVSRAQAIPSIEATA